MALNVGNTGTVSAGNGDFSINVSPVNQSVGVGANVGGGHVNVGVNSGGTFGANIQTGGGGDAQFGIGAGFNPGTGSFGVTPTVTIGDSKEAQTGAQVGGIVGGTTGSVFGPAGTAVGSFVGSATGSLVGNLFTHSQAVEQKNRRDTIINRLKDQGVWGEDYKWTNPDGSVFDFQDEDTTRGWRKQPENTPNELHSYEVDYTNDLDYLSSMAGITLGRILGGGISSAIDQVGSKFGNAFLGKAGYNNVLTPETFESVMGNARAGYAKMGIKNKEDMLSLANQMFGDGRINDTDYAAMNQISQVMYDGDFGAAQTLMGGRWKGIGVAGSTPSGGSASGGADRVRSPFISVAEAQASWAPIMEIYRQSAARNNLNGPKQGLQNVSSLSQAAGLISGVVGAYRGVNKITDGALGEYVKGGLSALRESLGWMDSGGGSTDVGGLDGEISPGEYNLDASSNLDYSSSSDSGYSLSDSELDLSF